jgi:hypothetical protein
MPFPPIRLPYNLLMESSISDKVRRYVYEHYIVPARQQQVETATVRAGDVAKAMRMRGRMPHVCGAIGAAKLQKDFGVKLLQRSGPGNGSNTIFIFQV